MKLIFLDFDGVINSHKFLASVHYGEADDGFYDVQREAEFFAANPGLDRIDLRQLDPTRVALINEIIEATGAKVVVSSSHRYGKSVAQLQAILEYHGFKGEVVGKTPDMFDSLVDFVGREDEIVGFLCFDAASVSCSCFIIIDDCPMDAYADRAVTTSLSTGITPDHVKQAIVLLNAE